MSLDIYNEIHGIYKEIRGEIEYRCARFAEIGRIGSDEELFYELVFCLLTPASRARSAWIAVKKIRESGLVQPSSACPVERIADVLNTVRFRNNKARRVCEALTLFSDGKRFSVRSKIARFKGVHERREWLVRAVKGIGYKEASHFLRNTGFSGDIAILDRHILRNLVRARVIDEIPENLGRKSYLSIEKKMIDFSHAMNLPVGHLDFVLWYRETGDIFK